MKFILLIIFFSSILLMTSCKDLMNDTINEKDLEKGGWNKTQWDKATWGK